VHLHAKSSATSAGAADSHSPFSVLLPRWKFQYRQPRECPQCQPPTRPQPHTCPRPGFTLPALLTPCSICGCLSTQSHFPYGRRSIDGPGRTSLNRLARRTHPLWSTPLCSLGHSASTWSSRATSQQFPQPIVRGVCPSARSLTWLLCILWESCLWTRWSSPPLLQSISGGTVVLNWTRPVWREHL